MSSSGEVLKRVDRRCLNLVGQDPHRHVHLIQGRAKAAQVYARYLAFSICEGIAAQKRIEALGIMPRDVMSVVSMRQVAKAGMDECPAEALHDTGCEGMEAFDDVSGQPLALALMIKARKSEIEFSTTWASTRRLMSKSAGISLGRPPSEFDGRTSTRATPRSPTTAVGWSLKSLTLQCARSYMRQPDPANAHASC